MVKRGCDLLENSYLCGSNNNLVFVAKVQKIVVICLKIPTFVVATTTCFSLFWIRRPVVICLKIPTFVVATPTDAVWFPIFFSCDLLENSYLCGSNNNPFFKKVIIINSCDLLENSYLCGSNNNSGNSQTSCNMVVICLKIPTFVVATTTITSMKPTPS